MEKLQVRAGLGYRNLFESDYYDMSKWKFGMGNCFEPPGESLIMIGAVADLVHCLVAVPSWRSELSCALCLC